jgi:hypothetical protein
VSILGQRPYEEIHSYMTACDVLIMPWRRSEWIEACNPVKLKEYLATGRPVVSTDFHELRSYDGLVRCVRDAEAFAEAIRAALRDGGDPRPRRQRVRGESWSSKAKSVLDALAARGVSVKSSFERGGSPRAVMVPKRRLELPPAGSGAVMIAPKAGATAAVSGRRRPESNAVRASR